MIEVRRYTGSPSARAAAVVNSRYKFIGSTKKKYSVIFRTSTSREQLDFAMKHYFIHENSLVAVVLFLLMHLPPFVICIKCWKNISENFICQPIGKFVFACSQNDGTDFNKSRKYLWFGWIRIHSCKCFAWTTIWFIEFLSEHCLIVANILMKIDLCNRDHSSGCINWQCSFKTHRSKQLSPNHNERSVTTLSGSVYAQ